MTSLVYCRGCAHQIHKTAVACPKCGAPNGVPAPKAAPAFGSAAYENYAQVPWFRKRWFAIICIVLFMPAFLLIAFTGDVYYEKKGELTTIPKRSRFIVLAIFVGMVILQLMKS